MTLKQIAKELDVSVSTVSKALSDSVEISADTKEKVKAFAKLYNYRPNNIALSLKNRKTKTIGVIIPDIVHYFFAKVIRGIEKVAVEKGYNVLVGLSNESFESEVINMETLANGSIDGFIISISKETLLKGDFHHFQETINQGMPIVMFDRVEESLPCDRIIVDDVRGARTAVEKLIQNGCNYIALLTTDDYVTVGKLRTQGYLEALERNQISVDSRLILKLVDEYESEERLDHLEVEIEKLLSNNQHIDGIFAVNELYALTAMNIAKRMGKRVPEDIQIIGFTDGLLSRHSNPSLSTVKQNPQKMGEKAAELLIERLENEEDEQDFNTVIIETELIERESTK